MNIDIILNDANFVRKLARYILTDEHHADDVVQETWIAALKCPPEESKSRSWLHSVVRNLSFKLLQKESRRKHNESASTGQEEPLTPEDLLERKMMYIRLMESVIALKEPYRTAIFLRYYEDLPPREIARSLELPLDSVKTHLKRGLAQLRQQLDGYYEGGRKEWAITLAGIAGLNLVPSTASAAASSATTGSLSIAGKAILAVSVAMVATIAVWNLVDDLEPAYEVEEYTLAEKASSVAFHPGEEEEFLTMPRPDFEMLEPDPVLLEEAPDPMHAATISGRIVTRDGSPLPGATVELAGWVSDSDRGAVYGRHVTWSNPETSSDAEGCFHFLFAPSPPLDYQLTVRHPGRVAVAWQWERIVPGSNRDLGDIVMSAGGRIRGRLLDRQGQVIKRGYSAAASSLDRRIDGFRVHPSNWVRPDPVTGLFLIDGLEPGPVKVHVYASGTGWKQKAADKPVVEVRAGSVTEVEIDYNGPDPERCISVFPRVESFAFVRPDPEHLKLIGPGAEVRMVQRSGRYHSSFDFADLSVGSYSIEIDDPRFLPWRKDDIRPGTGVIRPYLKGGAAVLLGLRDGVTGKAIESFSLSTEHKSTRRYSLLSLGQPVPRSGRISGLLVADQVLRIHAPGYAILDVSIEGLQRYEERRLDLELMPGKTLRGRLVNQHGSPVQAHEVWLKKRGGDLSTRHCFQAEEPVLASTLTDQEGCFTFDDLPSGDYWVGPAPVLSGLDPEGGDRAAPVAEPVFVPESGTIGDLELAAYQGLFIQGRVMDRDGKPACNAIVECSPANGAVCHKAFTESDGSFVLGPLVPGLFELLVRANAADGQDMLDPVPARPGDDVVLHLR